MKCHLLGKTRPFQSQSHSSHRRLYEVSTRSSHQQPGTLEDQLRRPSLALIDELFATDQFKKELHRLQLCTHWLPHQALMDSLNPMVSQWPSYTKQVIKQNPKSWIWEKDWYGWYVCVIGMGLGNRDGREIMGSKERSEYFIYTYEIVNNKIFYKDPHQWHAGDCHGLGTRRNPRTKYLSFAYSC